MSSYICNMPGINLVFRLRITENKIIDIQHDADMDNKHTKICPIESA